MCDFKNEKEWAATYKELLPGLYKKYAAAKYLPFDQQFELKPLFYNDCFDDLRDKWAKAAAEVLPLMKPGQLGGNALVQMTKWAAAANKKQFLLTHALDVVFYRFFPNVAAQVRARIHRQMLDGIKGADRWSVIAHSLGTSVIHDTLVWMFDPGAPKGRLPSGGFRMEALAMIANVSRVLESSGYIDKDGNSLDSTWDVYRSVVRPSADPDAGVCSSFLNAWHAWDPIPIPKQFKAAPDWPDRKTRDKKGSFVDIPIDGIEDIRSVSDVHDLGHYLRNPDVHIPLFNALIPIVGGIISEEEERDARREYRADNPLSRAKKKIEELKSFRLSDEEGDWQKILGMIHEFLK
jgi:hypothetical protein